MNSPIQLMSPLKLNKRLSLKSNSKKKKSKKKNAVSLQELPEFDLQSPTAQNIQNIFPNKQQKIVRSNSSTDLQKDYKQSVNQIVDNPINDQDEQVFDAINEQESPILQQQPQENQNEDDALVKNNEDQEEADIDKEIKEEEEKDLKKKKVKIKWSTYKRMLGYTRRQWFNWLIGGFFLLMQAITSVYIPYYCGLLLDTTIKYKNMEQLNQIALKASILFILNAVANFSRTFYFQIIGENMIKDMQTDCFTSFIRADCEFFDQNKTGELLSRLTNDLQVTRNAASGNISSTIRHIITCLGNLIMLFSISWKLSTLVILCMPIFLFSSGFYGKYVKKQTKKYQKFLSKISHLATECFQNICTIKSFSNEPKELRRFTKKMNKAQKLGKKKSFSQGLFNGITSLVSNAATLAVLWYGGELVIKSESITSGELSSILMYTKQLAEETVSLTWAYGKILTAIGGCETVFQLMDYKAKIPSEGGKKFDSFQGYIEFKNVTFSYPTSTVRTLESFNFKIKPGDHIAFVGPSGSGKSTIIRLLERFYDANKGKILVDGEDIKTLDISSLRRYIGYVAQEPVLFSGTIEENIAYGVEKYTQEEFDEACMMANAYDFLHDQQLFPDGLKSQVGEMGHNMSGGQKQRIAIARALIKKPKILIFDEATSALDAESEFLVQQAIDKLLQQTNMTIIIIAHRLSTIMKCQRITVLKSGKVAEIGNHKELMQKNGLYKMLVKKQMTDQEI